MFRSERPERQLVLNRESGKSGFRRVSPWTIDKALSWRPISAAELWPFRTRTSLIQSQTWLPWRGRRSFEAVYGLYLLHSFIYYNEAHKFPPCDTLRPGRFSHRETLVFFGLAYSSQRWGAKFPPSTWRGKCMRLPTRPFSWD